MKILHVSRFSDNRASGVRNVVPYHVVEEAKYADVLFQNIRNVIIPECEAYQATLDLQGWPRNIQKNGEPFLPDLVVFHSFYQFETIRLYRHLRRLHIPYIIVPHGCLMPAAQKNKRLKKFLGNLLFFNAYLKHAEAVQFLSQKEYDESLTKKPKFIGTNGIYLPQTRKQNFREAGIHFLFIGRLDVYYKGLDMLLCAIRDRSTFLRTNHCVFELYGPAEASVLHTLNKMISDYNIADLVMMHDGVYGLEKENAYLNADVFIQTSRSEGMPMGILEALSYGLPCLLTRATTLGEMVQDMDAGWMCENNVESIADKIQRSVEEKQLFEEKSNHAIELIEQNFMWSTVASETVAKYMEICGAKSICDPDEE